MSLPVTKVYPSSAVSDLKEFLFDSLITLRACALAILNLLRFSSEIWERNFLRASFFFFTANLQSSLNQGLFFLGFGDVFGIYISEIVRSVSWNFSKLGVWELFSLFWHSVLKPFQSAFLKLKRSGRDWANGMSGLI